MSDKFGYIQQQSDLDNVFVEDKELPDMLEGLGNLARTNLRKVRTVLQNLVPRKGGYAIMHRDFETKNLTGKALFERRLHLLPKEIREALYEARLQIVDFVIYGVEEGKDRNAFDIIYSSQTKKLGVSNISNGKLPQDRWFLLLGIALQEAVYNSTTQKYGAWQKITDTTRNGEWSLKIGGKPVYDELPLEIFARDDDDKMTGFVRLENPKLIAPQTDITFSVNLPSNSQNKFRAVLKGVATV